MTELKVIDTYWSDHCRHTTFNTELTEITFEDSTYGKLVEDAFKVYLEMREKVYEGRQKDICLMDMASIGTKYLKKDGKINSSDASLILAYYSYRSTGGTKPLEDVIDAL